MSEENKKGKALCAVRTALKARQWDAGVYIAAAQGWLSLPARDRQSARGAADWCDLILAAQTQLTMDLFGSGVDRHKELFAAVEGLEAAAAQAPWAPGLLDAGILIETQAGDLTPLEAASYSRDWRASRALLEAGADVNAQSAQGRGPLRCALDEYLRSCARLGEISERSQLRLLIESGAGIDGQTERRAREALAKARFGKLAGKLFEDHRGDGFGALWKASLALGERLALEKSAGRAQAVAAHGQGRRIL